MTVAATKNPAWMHTGFLRTQMNYLFITYIVTSKPKRISVAAGLVHIMISFFYFTEQTPCLVRVKALSTACFKILLLRIMNKV